MTKSILLFFVPILLFVAGCNKKHDPPLTPTEALLIGKAWKLQRADTTIYDSAQQVITGIKAFIPDCSNRKNIVFARYHYLQFYGGCEQPGYQPSGSWNWSLYTNNQSAFINFVQSASPRMGPVNDYNSDIVTLTADSLVLSTPVWAKYPNAPVYVNTPELIVDRYTH